MNHPADYPEQRDQDVDVVSTPLSVSHLVHTLRAYMPVIAISLISIAVSYAILAILVYVLSPEQRSTAQPFRLEFRGAEEGKLPNGVRFSPSEILNTPILLKVYAADELGRFTSFSAFVRSVVVLEANREYEKLLADYQSRLSDPRLVPIDRDRIEKEFEAKRASVSKNEFAISYARTSESLKVPESLVRKVLVDVLNTWAAFAIDEQHALDYRVAVLSPQILDGTELGSGDPVVAIEILRSKIYRVIENVDDLNKLPAAELMKTSDHVSLAEIRMRLEDIVRFRLEPLVGVARASGLVSNLPLTIHFLENQLAYDQRRLQAAQANVAATRDALLMYAAEQPRTTELAGTAIVPRQRTGAEGETVMPQLNDTFLERLMTLSKQANDSQYRQKMVQQYQDAVAATIPLEQAVRYQQQVLDQIKTGTPAPRSDERAVRAEIDTATSEVRRLIGKVNEIYQLLSRNLNPSTQLLSLTGPPIARIEHGRTIGRLAIYGVLVLLICLPVIIVLCLLHNRVREEEAMERTIPRAIEEPA